MFSSNNRKFSLFYLYELDMATYQKPSTRYATSDWFTSNYALSTNAERQRSATHDIRQGSRFLRNETSNKTKWDQLDSNTRLSDRVDNIRQWRVNIICI